MSFSLFLHKAQTSLWAGLLLLSLSPLFAQTNFYLAPNGNDSNDGKTPQSAFATLAHARDAVREVNASMNADIVVHIAAGDYPLDQTVEFTEQDSGNNGFNVIYQNQDKIGSARLSAGQKSPAGLPTKIIFTKLQSGRD